MPELPKLSAGPHLRGTPRPTIVGPPPATPRHTLPCLEAPLSFDEWAALAFSISHPVQPLDSGLGNPRRLLWFAGTAYLEVRRVGASVALTVLVPPERGDEASLFSCLAGDDGRWSGNYRSSVTTLN